MEFNNRPYDMKILSRIKPEYNYDIDYAYTNEDETLLIVGISLNKAAIEGKNIKYKEKIQNFFKLKGISRINKKLS